jgi:hypothetical protein
MSKLKKKKKKKERTKVDRRHGGNKCDSLPPARSISAKGNEGQR